MFRSSLLDDGIRRPRLNPGQTVEVLSAREILATLDQDGKLDGVPFMPEMLPFCGRSFRIGQRADVSCHGGRPRQLSSTVYLDNLRCDGSAHHDCQARCRLLWKESWLRPVDGVRTEPESIVSPPDGTVNNQRNGKRPVSFLWGSPVSSNCQAVELGTVGCPLFTSHQEYFRSVFTKLLTGTLTMREIVTLASYARGKAILMVFKLWARAPRNKSRYTKTPAMKLGLRTGEWVQVRSMREILRTLDAHGRNRGMAFGPEMFQFCGKKFRVVGRVNRYIDEHSGQPRDLANECILLDSVECHGQRFFCTRGTYHYWREIWLRRCEPEIAHEVVPSVPFRGWAAIQHPLAAATSICFRSGL